MSDDGLFELFIKNTEELEQLLESLRLLPEGDFDKFIELSSRVLTLIKLNNEIWQLMST